MLHKRDKMNKKFILLNEKSELELLNYLPSQSDATRLADFFQIFSDPTRLKIISCLAMKDLCVNDISKILKINQTTISHQLKYLKTQNLITSKRNGKIIVYSLKNLKTNDLLLTAVNAI